MACLENECQSQKKLARSAKERTRRGAQAAAMQKKKEAAAKAFMLNKDDDIIRILKEEATLKTSIPLDGAGSSTDFTHPVDISVEKRQILEERESAVVGKTHSKGITGGGPSSVGNGIKQMSSGSSSVRPVDEKMVPGTSVTVAGKRHAYETDGAHVVDLSLKKRKQ